MNLISKLLNILVLLLAIVTLVFGFLLFNKRQQLRDHGAVLGDTMAKVATEIQFDGNANYQTDGTGELGYKAETESLKTVSQDIVNQAKKLREQKDALGAGIADLAVKLELAPDITKEDLQDKEKYAQSIADVGAKVGEISDRNDQLISGLATVGSAAGVNVAEEDLTSADSVRDSSDKVANSIKDMKQNTENYQRVVKSVVEVLGDDFEGVSVDALSDPDSFTDANKALQTGLGSISSKLSQFAAKEKQIGTLNEEIEAKDAAIDGHIVSIDALKMKTSDLQNRIADLTEENKTLQIEVERTRGTDLTGKIVQVNYEWNFVTINLGSSDGLPENLTMIVSRDREYITQVLVTRVFKDYAIAEINPDHQKGQVLQNDDVFFMQ